MEVFAEEATSVLAGCAGPLARSNFNLEVVFLWREVNRKTRKQKKTPRYKVRTSKKLNPYMTPSRNRTQVTLLQGERSHHCAIPAPKFSCATIYSQQSVPAADSHTATSFYDDDSKKPQPPRYREREMSNEPMKRDICLLRLY